jgi:5-formyltetrahydrofolate cyclo-ligase
MNEIKEQIRNEMRKRRNCVSQEEREEASEALVANILNRSDIQEAIVNKRPFAVYLATEHELDLTKLVEELWSEDITVVVPCWDAVRKMYVMGTYDNTTTLVEGDHHIPEPAEVNEINPEDIGVWIIPGLAFTRDGKRVGYGGGWFDRLLDHASKEAVLLGVAHTFQVVEELPVEDHDRLLTGVVTPEEE